MNASPFVTACRAAAIVYALGVAVLTLLPSKYLAAWAPFALQDALDPEFRALAATGAVAAGLLLLGALALALARRWRPRLAPRLRLSWPLLLVLVAYLAGLALLASGQLRAAAWDVALEELPGWLEHAARRLRPATGHALAYVGLGLLLALAWGRQLGLWPLGLLAFALSGAAEALQELVPGREPSRWDLIANGLGLAVGLTAGGVLIGQPPGDFVRRRSYRRRAGPRRRSA